MYGACRPQIHDLGERKFGDPLSRDNHRTPVWRLLFSSMLPASIPAVLLSRNARKASRMTPGIILECRGWHP
ncbi:hypothetical protein T05_6140 [Trichinella murrelli]|uniref:Uncharacterized protein n=1 Tax=Trichinella murrelli TaxID=144512 RepID=A0A0V0TS33_9BILA|nr:hypothetical protein T05_6140 [Trichinella murrelli]